MTDKEIKVTFLPGALDEFDGTQEELDALVADIKNLALHGNLYEKSVPVDMEALAEEDPDLYEILTQRLNSVDQRKLN